MLIGSVGRGGSSSTLHTTMKYIVLDCGDNMI